MTPSNSAGVHAVTSSSLSCASDWPNDPTFNTGIKYIFGTAFDETHKEIEEEDLHHEHYGPDVERDVPDRAHGKTREQILHEARRGKLDLSQGPKPLGWFGACFRSTLGCAEVQS